MSKNPKSPYSKLEMKKKTLAAWTKLLLNSGEIDIKKYNRMIMMIERLAHDRKCSAKRHCYILPQVSYSVPLTLCCRHGIIILTKQNQSQNNQSRL